MTLLVITKSPHFFANRRLLAESKEINIPLEFRATPPEALSSYSIIWNRVSGVDFNDGDLLLLEKATSSFLINPLSAQKVLRDKFKQFLYFQKYDFNPIPSQMIADYDGNFTYPVLIKTIRGNQGRGQFIIHSKNELALFKEQNDQRYLIQPLLKGFKEFRFFMLKQNCLMAVEKLPSNKGHLRNKRYSEWKEHLPTKKQLLLLEKIVEKMDLHICAIEIIEMNNETFLLEINGNPSWEEMENVSGRNLTKEILKFVAKKRFQ